MGKKMKDKKEGKKIRYYNLNRLIMPKSVAIVGASYDADKVGHIILRNYLNAGFSGKLFPVNINAAGDMLGLKVYKTISDIKQKIDLVVVATPASTVPDIIDQCGKANVGGVVVISSGFAEVGNIDLQKQLIENAKKYKLPVIGPNCLGLVDIKSKTDTMYLPSFKLDKPILGDVSVISQSGAVGSIVLDLIDHEGFGLAKFISYGNADVVDESDILTYLANDNETKFIIFYLEGVKDGKRFIETVKKYGLKKPIIIIKAGTTAEGATAAHSHTAALAGNSEVYNAIFKQYGIVQAEDLYDLLYFAKIFEMSPLCTGNKVGVITNGGGAGVLMTDAIYKNGLELAQLSDKSKENLRKVMPNIVNITSPLDIGGDADRTRFKNAIDAVATDDNVDIIIAIVLFQTPGADSSVVAEIVNAKNRTNKPFIVISIGGNYTLAHRSMLESANIPVYESPMAAAKAIKALIDFSNAKIQKK